MAKLIKSCLIWDEDLRPNFTNLLQIINKMEKENFLQVLNVAPYFDNIHMPKNIDCVFMLDCTG